MELRKLSRQTLTDQAVDSLLDYIRQNELKPGDMLPSETVLANHFGVSRPVIREALKSLEGRNMIEIINGRGAAVKPLESEDLHGFFSRAVHFDQEAIRELLEVRQGLEVQAARIAAMRRTDDDIAELTQITAQMRAKFQDDQAYSDSDLAFHLALARATHNAMMLYLIESIRQYARGSMYQWHLSRRTQEEYERIQRLHEAILDRIVAGEPEQAAVAMSNHFEDAIFDLEHRKQSAPDMGE